MRKRTKLTLLQIVVVIFAVIQFEGAQAANLKYVRTGKHENFMRVVFEFQNNVQYKSPEITGKGQFSVVFFDATTNLPSRTLYKTGPLQLVQSVEFVREKSNITANVRLSFPYFILKAYPLSGPDRIVVDAYWMSSSPEESGQEASLSEKSLMEPTPPTENNELKTTPQEILAKESPEQATKPLSTKTPEQSETPAPQNTVSKQLSNQGPDKTSGSSLSSKDYYTLQTYLLVALNVFTGCIVVLLIFALFKKRHIVEFDHFFETMDFIKKTDESISAIDAEIESAFKQYDQF